MGKKYPNMPRSPYDPKFRDKDSYSFGKIEPARNEDQYQVTGCGDPFCVACNSHIPEEVARRMPSNGGGVGRMSSSNPFGGDNPFRAAINEIRRREMMGMMPVVGAVDPNEPPQSYKDAREAVEDYLLEAEHTTSGDDVIGNDNAKAALLEAIEEPTKNPGLYEYYGMTPPKGILLFGPPGCGKTMFAKASATAMSRIHGKKVDIISVAAPALQQPYIGATEALIAAMFNYAREYKKFHGHPLIIFIDEAETLLPDRTGRTRRVAPWEESQVAQFLTEMDGMETLGAFVILATNRPEAIDEALLRDGRCDRKIKVERPGRLAVEHILKNSFKAIPLAVDIESIVMAGVESFYNPHYVIHEGHYIEASLMSDGSKKINRDIGINFNLEHIVSGAMVQGVSNRAKSRAFRRDRDKGTMTGVTTQDVVDSVKEIYEENKGLEHAFAIREFIENFPIKEMKEQPPRKDLQ